MTTGENGLSLITHSEGLRTESYQDSVGVWTIGFGHTRNVKEGDVITMDQAYLYLQSDLRPCEQLLNGLDISFTQNQFDALVSFIFNLGSGNFLKSTLLKKIKVDPNDPTIADEFIKWNHAGGQVLPGLTKRRQAEKDLYFS